jgi:hypothetical protein
MVAGDMKEIHCPPFLSILSSFFWSQERVKRKVVSVNMVQHPKMLIGGKHLKWVIY